MKRKTNIIIMLVFMGGLTSCLGILCINGDGVFASEERREAGFYEIENTTSANVLFTVSDEYSVRVEADRNIMEYIHTSVSAGVLEIEIKGTRCIRPARTPVVFVSGPALSRIYLGGSGDMFADTLSGDRIDMVNTGSGNIVVYHASATEAGITNSGSGSITGRHLYSDELSVSISGTGDVIAVGELDVLNITSAGTGIMAGDDLSANFCNALLSGSGNVYVNVIDELIATISGSGNLYYTGYPDIYENISGSGRIFNLNK
jgi:hypothetical protein